jgi:uncharacterized membrane protein
VLGGIGLSFGTTAIDRYFDYGLIPQIFTGGPAAAQYILSTIASSMMTLISLVLTVTLVAVQLAMAQFSPRIVRALLSDRWNQIAIGLFAAAFVYPLLTLRGVDEHAGLVPGLGIVVSYLLTTASVIALILYVNHASQSLRVGGLVDLAGDSLREQLKEFPPLDQAEPVFGQDDRTIVAQEPGVVVLVDHEGLVAEARSVGCVLEMVPMMGDFVPAGETLFRVHGGDPAGLESEKIVRLVKLDRERTHDTDPAFGFRKLVDIAERSIAQPFDDPTTAVQAIDRLHDCLRHLATRRLPSGGHFDAEGQLRLVVRTLGWDGYVRLVFDELRIVGADQPQVTRRLCAALENLKTVAPLNRQRALDRQLYLLKALVRQEFEDEEDISASLTGDQQGIGSGQDVMSTNSWTDGPPFGEEQG